MFLHSNSELIQQLMDALGLPKGVKKFTITAELNKPVIVECTFMASVDKGSTAMGATIRKFNLYRIQDEGSA